jgi:type I restriction enzyme S subunit
MKRVELGSVASVKSGFAFKSKDWKDSGVPVIKIANVKDGFVTLDGCSFVDENVARDASAFELKPGDILISMTGYIGEVARVRNEGRMLLNQRVGKFSIKNSELLDSDFLFYCLRDPELKAKFVAHAYGAAQPNISPTLIEQQDISLPPLPIQRRIAGILSAYDELIENSQRRIKILEAMARALYREWFVHFRFPGHESVPRVPSPLGDIPQGWEVKTVSQVAGIVSRGPSLTYVASGGVQVVNQRCIRNEGIEMQAVQYARPLPEKKSHLYLQPQDILINSMGVGTLGRVSRNLSIDELTIIHNCITVVRGKTGEPTTTFLYYRLSDCQDHFERLGVGATGQTSLRIETIEEVQFAFPPIALLSAFEQAVMPMWINIGRLKRQIQNLRRTRDLLLPRLLSGQIDVEAMPL